MQPNEWLKWICSSENDAELSKNYDQWAATYEADIIEVWKTVPLAAAKMLAEYVKNKKDWILDVGAGTGMVGVALAELGFKNIIGIDISPGMLEKAAQKGVYRSLVCCAIADKKLNTLKEITDKEVTGIVATGVFAERHAGSADIATIQSNMKPGGIFVFTVRQSFLPEIQPTIDHFEWIHLDSRIMPIYEDPMYLIAYRINASH